MSYTTEQVAGALLSIFGGGKAEIKKIAALLNITESQAHHAFYKKWRPAGDKLVKAACEAGRLDGEGGVDGMKLKANAKGGKRAAEEDAEGKGAKKVKVEKGKGKGKKAGVEGGSSEEEGQAMEGGVKVEDGEDGA
ncbi:hypothetical protein C1H76_1820 [Elsinoe australis]|uniref:Uncharacterized protein n=1 Tax=Elsinoe australis TaxID=40998 RepID=A0A4U7BC90_9PEZI|nr:hypothetical protein C1H76_1820 [Elsinoe australis]